MKAIVNYHISSDTHQAYHIDLNGHKGITHSPELNRVQVNVTDVRELGELDFFNDGITFLNHHSCISNFEDATQWQDVYEKELKALLVSKINAAEVIIFDHTLRVDDQNSERKPARNVHGDYSVASANERLIDVMGEEKARLWQAGHFAFINAWRPVQETIKSAPLGFIRPASLVKDDWMKLHLIYPDRIGEIMGVVENDAHEWMYLPDMTPSDMVLFNVYDNQGLAAIAHSALDLVTNQTVTQTRRSIETRMLIRY